VSQRNISQEIYCKPFRSRHGNITPTKTERHNRQGAFHIFCAIYVNGLGTTSPHLTQRNNPSDSALTSALQDDTNEDEDEDEAGDDKSRADRAALSIRSQVASMALKGSVQFGGLGASNNAVLPQGNSECTKSSLE
jgi:hypothetical protein